MTPTDPISRLNAALEGRYRVERQLGEGGMATVYLARDEKHNRNLAVKVLKPELAAVVGAERFVVEIETTANLQHPHILPLFDSGEADSFLFYVMPYVEGESLRERLDREGQLPVDEAVRITQNVAEALDYAHAQGVVHRDVKPANILLHAGKPVVSDFGIALALGAAGAGRLTETGLSLGTPHYMSPEQATGSAHVGEATDTYALGCVLYEMLVGEPPFTGSTPQALLAKIVTGEVELASTHRKSVPGHVDAAIRKALEKVPADRFTSTGDLARALADPSFRYETAFERTGGGSHPWRAATLAVGVVAVGLAAVAFSALERAPVPAPVSRYVLTLPPGQERSEIPDGSFALSDDGSRLVYPGPDGRLWMLERRNQLAATQIDGTEGAVQPFFSPDGTQVAFITERSELVLASLSDQPTRTLVPGDVWYGGGDWGDDGYLYYSNRVGLGLHRIRADGTGEPELLTRLDGDRSEVVHTRPHVLPGGEELVLQINRSGEPSEIAVLTLRSRERRAIATGRMPRVAESGHLVYVADGGVLFGAPFDMDRLELAGAAEPILPNVLEFALTPSGRLLYLSGEGLGGQVVAVGRDGSEAPVDSAWVGAADVRVSPDGARLAATSRGNVWIGQFEGRAWEQLTFEGGTRPEWTSDGESVTYLAGGDLYRRPADGTGVPELLKDLANVPELEDEPIQEGLLTPSGELILRIGTQSERDLFVTSPGPAPVRELVADPTSGERSPALSPDGRFLAYVSLQDGTDDVFVRPFPNADDWVRHVSQGGGREPSWSNDGGELFFRDGANQLVSVAVTTEPVFVAGRRMALFSMTDYDENPNHTGYDVTADDQRFIMSRQASAAPSDRLVVIENFLTLLRERVDGS